MVFFTCDACGASLKKNQVEKHYLQQCRSCSVLTCIDCQKDFPGDTYKEHIRCITEEEKYSAKGWQPKASANKGLKKQEAWVENIRLVMSERGNSLDADVRRLLDTVVKFDNIPRKRNKFINFVQNALGKRTPAATIDKTWEVFEEAIKPKPVASSNEEASKSEENEQSSNEVEEGGKHEDPSDFSLITGSEKKKKKENKRQKKEYNLEKETEVEKMETTADDDDAQTENQGVKMFRGTKSVLNGQTNGNDATAKEEKAKKKGKRQREAEEEEEQTEKKAKLEAEEESSGADENNPKKFNWELQIRKLLEKKGAMKVKRVKKKIVDEFVKQNGDTVKTRIQLEAKLEKKLKKNKEFKYVNDTVSLASSRD